MQIKKEIITFTPPCIFTIHNNPRIRYNCKYVQIWIVVLRNKLFFVKCRICTRAYSSHYACIYAHTHTCMPFPCPRNKALRIRLWRKMENLPLFSNISDGVITGFYCFVFSSVKDHHQRRHTSVSSVSPFISFLHCTPRAGILSFKQSFLTLLIFTRNFFKSQLEE